MPSNGGGGCVGLLLSGAGNQIVGKNRALEGKPFVAKNGALESQRLALESHLLGKVIRWRAHPV